MSSLCSGGNRTSSDQHKLVTASFWNFSLNLLFKFLYSISADLKFLQWILWYFSIHYAFSTKLIFPSMSSDLMIVFCYLQQSVMLSLNPESYGPDKSEQQRIQLRKWIVCNFDLSQQTRHKKHDQWFSKLVYNARSDKKRLPPTLLHLTGISALECFHLGFLCFFNSSFNMNICKQHFLLSDH